MIRFVPRNLARALSLCKSANLARHQQFFFKQEFSHFQTLAAQTRRNLSSSPHSEEADKRRNEAEALKFSLEKGKASMMKGDYTSAEKLFEQALGLSLKLFGESGQYVGVCYYSLGHILSLKGEKRESREYYLKAYDILAQDRTKYKNHLLQIERALSKLGHDSKLRGKDLKDTKQKLEEELVQLLDQEKNDEVLVKIGNIYNSLGTISQQEGSLSDGIKFKQRALECFEKVKAPEALNLFFIYLDLGTFYKENKLFPESLEYLTKALGTLKNAESEKAEGLKFIALHNIGKIHIIMKNYEKALEPFEQAIEIKEFSPIRDEGVLRSLYHEVGMIYFFLKNGKKSIQYFEKALEFQQKAGDENFLARIYQHIGESYLFLEADFANSKKYFERALKLRKMYQGADSEETKSLENILQQIEKIPSKK